MWIKILVVICVVLTTNIFEALECEIGRNKPTFHQNPNPSDEHPPSLSVDGDLNTYSKLQSWLRIDLGQEYMITRIVISNIYSLSNIDNQFLKSFRIEITLREEYYFDLFHYYYWADNDKAISQSITIKKSESGRYVHVYNYAKVNNEPLTIAEINIFAEFSSPQAGYECNIAVDKAASQISTSDYHEANRAINGFFDSYSKTQFSSNGIQTWLQVDLFQNYLILKVVVSNMIYESTDKMYLRYFAIFVRQTNETTDRVGTAFGSTDRELTKFDTSSYPSIVFFKSEGEIGRYVTVVKEGPTFMEPLVITDLCVYTIINVLRKNTTTTTTTSKTTSVSNVLPFNNETCLLQCTQQKSQEQNEIRSHTADKIVIGIVVGVLAIIAGTLLGFACGYRCQKKKNQNLATYENTTIQNTDPNMYSEIDNNALHQMNPYDNENKL